MNSLVMTCNFVYCVYTVDEAVLAMEPTPCDMLIRLRGQLESLSKGEALYSRRDANWIDWEDAQKSRIAAEAHYKSLPAAPPARKLHALKEWLIISLHTLQPRAPQRLQLRLCCLSTEPSPHYLGFESLCGRLADRVGVVRKLRLGVTLKKEASGSYTLDMTSARYKTSRFYGPSITSMSALLQEPLDLYLGALTFETAGNEQPYIFYPTSDTTRCLPSSQWSAVVKACFKKHSPGKVAPPPKLLRASFITWLRVRPLLMSTASSKPHKQLAMLSCVAGLDRCTGGSQGRGQGYASQSARQDLLKWLLQSSLGMCPPPFFTQEATQQSDRYDKAR